MTAFSIFCFSPVSLLLFHSFILPNVVKHLIVTASFNSRSASPFQVLHRMGPLSQPVYLVQRLKPYHVYNFTVTVCTKTGCIASLPSTGRTLPAGKKKKKIWTQTHMDADKHKHTFKWQHKSKQLCRS